MESALMLKLFRRPRFFFRIGTSVEPEPGLGIAQGYRFKECVLSFEFSHIYVFDFLLQRNNVIDA